MRRAPLALLAVLGLTACGVGSQSAPEPISIPRPSATQPDATGGPDGPRVTVWFVRGRRLEPVERGTPRPGIDAALDALVAGPTRGEVVDGLRTALSPQSLMPDRPAAADAVVTIEVAREFTEVAGANQLLATAQVVFTVTEFPEVEAVRITAEGSPVEVPTDEGLTAEPVGRDDYSSVAAPDPSPSPGPPPTPTTPPSGGSAATPPPTPPTTTGRRRRLPDREAARVPAHSARW